MNNFEINLNWDFNEAIQNAKILKTTYDLFLVSFYFFKTKDRNDYIRTIKKQIYSLKIPIWKHDKLWEYLNGDLEYEELLKIKDI